MKYCFLLVLLVSYSSFGQSRLVLDKECSILGSSVSDKLSYFEDPTSSMSPEDFLEKRSTLDEVKMTTKLQNLDFTKSSFFIHFTLDNQSGKDQSLVLETARPITNRVDLYCVDTKETMLSGDGIPFDKKSVPTNFSALEVFVSAGEKREYVLHITSDGESLIVPMVFFDRKEYIDRDSNRQLLMGIFLGVFIFVVIIYTGFFVLLKERLFLIYVLYATSSGLLQFSLDGYMHEFVFTSGGYFAQHIVPFIAGPTIVLGLLYTSGYLALTGLMKKICDVFVVSVLVTMLLSLLPGTPYELCYILLNVFSFLLLVFMMTAGLIQRKRNKEQVSLLFLIGFACLVLGGLVYILGNFGVIDAQTLTLNALKIGTMIEMVFLSILMAERYKGLQKEREIAQERLLIELEEKNKIASETNEQLEFEVRERTHEIEAQRVKLKEQNEDFLSSVVYAKRIQNAVLSNEEKFKRSLPDSFMFHKAKDVVSGDFYWVDESKSGQIAYVTADCTGHGVPGALMSIIGNHMFESLFNKFSLSDPGKILDEVNLSMRKALNTQYSVERINDGMDLTMCVLDLESQNLSFAGARNSVFIVRNGELIELKGDRKSIGFNPRQDSHNFLTQQFALEKEDMIYTCSDGFADQFGGDKGKKFMTKRLKELFVELSKLPISEQKEHLEGTLVTWMGDYEQLDDILVVGVKI